MVETSSELRDFQRSKGDRSMDPILSRLAFSENRLYNPPGQLTVCELENGPVEIVLVGGDWNMIFMFP